MRRRKTYLRRATQRNRPPRVGRRTHSDMSEGSPPRFCLRVKLVRGCDGVDLGATSGVIVALNGRARTEGTLQVGDTLVDPPPAASRSKCEVTVLRDDAALRETLLVHGMLRDDGGAACFRLLKVPVQHGDTSSSDGATHLGIEADGLHVQSLTGKVRTDALIAAGDIITAVDGKRATSESLQELLRKPTAMPFRLLSVLRKCDEHALSALELERCCARADGSALSASADERCCAQADGGDADGASSAGRRDGPDHCDELATDELQRRTADGPPKPLEDAAAYTKGGHVARPASGHRYDVQGGCTTEVATGLQAGLALGEEARLAKVSSEAYASGRPLAGPARRLEKARGAAAAAATPPIAADTSLNIGFEPLNNSIGLWCDLPPSAHDDERAIQQSNPPLAYDARAGKWSDLPGPSPVVLSGAQRPVQVQSRRAVLDLMIKQALACTGAESDALLRSLVAERHSLPPAHVKN